jgi:hypothetical protein
MLRGESFVWFTARGSRTVNDGLAEAPTNLYYGAVPSASLNMPNTIVAYKTLRSSKRARRKVHRSAKPSSGCNLLHLEGGAGD